MTVIDVVFCVGRACDKQTRDTFQSSRLTIQFMGSYCFFYRSMLYSNGAVMPSYDVRLSVRPSVCDVGDS